MQLLLIDQPPDMPITNSGQARTRIGNVVEELLCRVMGWEHKPPYADPEFTPDALFPLLGYIEIKSAGVTKTMKGRSVLYDCRMKKEAVKEPDLLYAFACHRHTKTNHTSIGGFLDHVAKTGLNVIIAPASVVHELAYLQPLNTIKNYEREGYKDGYRNLQLQDVAKLRTFKDHVTEKLWGYTFKLTIHHVK